MWTLGYCIGDIYITDSYELITYLALKFDLTLNLGPRSKQSVLDFTKNNIKLHKINLVVKEKSVGK